jgi:steroid delta-isomerase-like uncharacterized protein
MGDARQVVGEFTDAFNAHDEGRIRELYGDSSVFEAPGDVRLKGTDAITGYAMSWLNAFPDARMTIHNELVAGDSVAQEFTFDGTHEATLSGPAGDIPATHKQLSGRGSNVVRVEGGKIAEVHLYFDQVDVLTQLGLMPEPVGAAS